VVKGKRSEGGRRERGREKGRAERRGGDGTKLEIKIFSGFLNIRSAGNFIPILYWSSSLLQWQLELYRAWPNFLPTLSLLRSFSHFRSFFRSLPALNCKLEYSPKKTRIFKKLFVFSTVGQRESPLL
jgi:hypothetical protein